MNPDRIKRRLGRVEDMRGMALDALGGTAQADNKRAQSTAAIDAVTSAIEKALASQKDRIASLIFNSHRRGCGVGDETPCTCGAHEFAEVVKSFETGKAEDHCAPDRAL